MSPEYAVTSCRLGAVRPATSVARRTIRFSRREDLLWVVSLTANQPEFANVTRGFGLWNKDDELPIRRDRTPHCGLAKLACRLPQQRDRPHAPVSVRFPCASR